MDSLVEGNLEMRRIGRLCGPWKVERRDFKRDVETGLPCEIDKRCQPIVTRSAMFQVSRFRFCQVSPVANQHPSSLRSEMFIRDSGFGVIEVDRKAGIACEARKGRKPPAARLASL